MSNNKIYLRPRTVRRAIEGMPFSFDPAEAEGVNATIQFHLSGDDPGDYYLSIADGTCDFAEGMTNAPTLTIYAPSDVWLKIARGELNGSLALMTGKYQARGQIGLLMKMNSIFSRQPTEAELAEKGWI